MHKHKQKAAEIRSRCWCRVEPIRIVLHSRWRVSVKECESPDWDLACFHVTSHGRKHEECVRRVSHHELFHCEPSVSGEVPQSWCLHRRTGRNYTVHFVTRLQYLYPAVSEPPQTGSYLWNYLVAKHLHIYTFSWNTLDWWKEVKKVKLIGNH